MYIWPGLQVENVYFQIVDQSTTKLSFDQIDNNS